MDSLVLLKAKFMITPCLESMDCIEDLDEEQMTLLEPEPKTLKKLNKGF